MKQKNTRRRRKFPFNTWGGKRENAGRKPKGDRAGVSHRPRPPLASRFPVHITLRVAAGLPNLRSEVCTQAIEKAFIRTSDKPGFRLVHYSVQADVLHLLCEAKDTATLSRGLQGLSISVARRLNRALERRGRVLADRYDSRILRTPGDVRKVLVRLLCNAPPPDQNLHPSSGGPRLDPCSSARYFDGWRDIEACPLPKESPVARPGTWLVRTGWRRLGLLSASDLSPPQVGAEPQ